MVCPVSQSRACYARSHKAGHAMPGLTKPGMVCPVLRGRDPFPRTRRHTAPHIVPLDVLPRDLPMIVVERELKPFSLAPHRAGERRVLVPRLGRLLSNPLRRPGGGAPRVRERPRQPRGEERDVRMTLLRLTGTRG